MPITPVVIDFETASSCDLKKAGSWRYAEDPTTEILCLAYNWGTDVKLWLPTDVPFVEDQELRNLVADPNIWFVAHNVQFEKAIWRHIMVKQFGFADIPNTRWHDTQATCAMRVIPQDLEDAIRVLRLPHAKDTVGSKHTIGLSRPNKQGYLDRTPQSLRITYDYCKQDIRGEVELLNRLGWLPPGERTVWLLNQRINERGVRLDLDYVRACQSIVDRASAPLLAEFRQITGIEKLGSPKLLDWCDDQGVRLPNLQKETLAEVLGGSIDDVDETPAPEDASETPFFMGDLPDVVHRALTIRQLIGSASIKKLARMEACVGADGRARGLLQYHGTGPGRSAGRLLQPQNFPRGTIMIGGEAPPPELVVNAIMTGDPDYVATVLGPPVECVVSGLRHALVPNRGRVFCAGDYSGIQARIVLSLGGEHAKTALMASGADIYCDMATQIYKRPINKKNHPVERQTGKNSVLGLGFQMGAPKFQFKYGKYKENGVTKIHSLDFCKEVVRVYRKEWAPGVPKVWYGLEEAAVSTVWDKTPHEAFGVEYRLEDGWLTARLPSGRKMWYFDPQPVRRQMPYDPDIVKQAFTYKAQKMGVWRTIDAFGGQLTENVVMGIERDVMTNAQLLLEKNGFPVVLEVHDEIVCEPLEQEADEKAFEQIMLDTPAWVDYYQIPIATETWVGDRYKK